MDGSFQSFERAANVGKKGEKTLDWYSSNFSCMFFACKYVSEDVSENCLWCNSVHFSSLFSDAVRIPLSFARNTGFSVFLSHKLEVFFGKEYNKLINN